MKLNKYLNPIFMFLLILCLGTGCKNEGGGGGGSSTPVNDNNSTNDDNPTNDDNSPEDSEELTMELSWNAPTTRQNGDELELYEIGGYEIVYAKVEDEYGNAITIHDEEKKFSHNYTITGFPPGRYAVEIRVFDIDGLYSPPSDTVYVDKF